MDKLKKFFAVGGALCLIACWPLVVGQIGQRVAENALSEVHNRSYEIKLVKYDRGYLSSDAQVKVSITNPQLKAVLKEGHIPTDYLFNSHFTHGFFSINGVTSSVDQTLPISVVSETHLNGSTELFAKVGGIDYQDSHSSWGYHLPQSTVEADITANGQVSYQIHIPDFRNVSSDGTEFDVGNVSISGNGVNQNRIWIGDNTVKIGSVSLSESRPGVSGQNFDIQIRDISYKLLSEMDAGKTNFSSSHHFTVDSVSNGAGQIDNGELDVTIGDLNAGLLQKLAVLSDSLSSSKNVSEAENVRAQMIDLINRLIAKGLYVNIDKLGFSYKQGSMNNQLKLSLSPRDEKIKADIATIAQSLQGEVTSAVDKKLASEFPNLQESLDELVVMEMATDQGKGYELKATIKDGVVLFPNGKKIPIINVLFPLFVR
ncbi:DUF945 family protein [Vibrio salinus]|uniref:DUF945 family protein n=1 Tax=Vibrio salinus TaxID=2899784 RepID=UPI001E5826AC|nr:DUF945 family protein [Vibrio salinus]MCE0492747.1 YdgA family protein [Vibrio salinus]